MKIYISKQDQKKNTMTISFYNVVKHLESKKLKSLKKFKKIKNKSARFQCNKVERFKMKKQIDGRTAKEEFFRQCEHYKLEFIDPDMVHKDWRNHE